MAENIIGKEIVELRLRAIENLARTTGDGLPTLFLSKDSLAILAT